MRKCLIGLLVGAALLVAACGPVAPVGTPTPLPTVPAGYQRICYDSNVAIHGGYGNVPASLTKDTTCVVVKVWQP